MYIFSLIIEVFSDIITYIISFSIWIYILTLSIVIIVNFVCVYIVGAT